MKNLNKILLGVMVPIIAGSLIGCKGKNTFRDTAKRKQEKVYEVHILKVK